MAKTRRKRPIEPAAEGPPVAPPPVQAPSRWILGPTLDSILFIGAPLLVMAVFLPLKGVFSSREIAIFLLAFFTFGHHFPTFLRAYGDRELFERFKWRFLLGPPLLFGAALWFDANQLHGLLIFVALWDIWHVLMQHYGFMRIYDSKAGAVGATTSWLDWALSISWYVALIAVSPHYSHNLLARAYDTGLPLIPAEVVAFVRTGLLSVSALITLAYVGYHLNEWRAGRPVSWRKLTLLSIFLGATWYLYVGLNDFLVGFTVWSAFHCIQYYGIVWVYSRNRVVKKGPVAGFVKFLFRPSVVLVALYAGLILAYGGINYLAPAVPDAFLQRLLIAYIVTSNAMHYYFDGFIWKMRDKNTRADLQIADAGAQPKTARAWLSQVFARVAPQNKGWQQAAYIAAVLLLFVGLERGRSSNDLAVAESLVAAAPTLGEPQYNLGNALWRRGRLDEAYAAFERAAELLPDSSKVYNNLGGILYDQGKFEEAVAMYRQALDSYREEDEQALRSSAPLMPGDAASLAASPEIVEGNLGQALARLGKTEEAIKHYQKALAIDPYSAKAQAGLGMALGRLERYDDAVAALRRALEIDPGYASAHINLGGLLAYQGQVDQAAWHYNAALVAGDARAQQAAAAALAQLEGQPPHQP